MREQLVEHKFAEQAPGIIPMAANHWKRGVDSNDVMPEEQPF